MVVFLLEIFFSLLILSKVSHAMDFFFVLKGTNLNQNDKVKISGEKFQRIVSLIIEQRDENGISFTINNNTSILDEITEIHQTFGLFITSSSEIEENHEQEQDLSVEIDQNAFLWILSENNNASEFDIWDFYKMKNNYVKTQVHRMHLGLSSNFNKLQNFLQYEVPPMITRRLNFHRIEIVGVISENDLPIIQYRLQNQLEIPTLFYILWLGMDAFLDLQVLLNFSYRIKSQKDPLQLLEDPKAEADLAIYYMSQTYARSQKLALLQPMLESKYKAFFKMPRTNSLRNAHIKPFSTIAWISLGSIWIIYFMAMSLIQHLTPVNENEPHSSEGWWFWIPSLISGQFPVSIHELQSIRSQLRCCLLIGSILGMLIQIYYSSTILSALKVIISPIQSFDNLIQLKFRFSTHVSSKPLQEVTQKILDDNKLTQKLILVDNAQQIKHFLLEAEAAPIATVTYSDSFFREVIAQNYSFNFICNNMGSIGINRERPFRLSFATRKGSQFKEYFNYGLIKILERGLGRRYSREYDNFQNNFACNSMASEGGNRLRVEISDIVLPFMILFCGFVVSLVCCVTGKYAHKIDSPNDKKRIILHIK